VVGASAQYIEPTIRSYLIETGHEHERERAKSCDRRALVAIVSNRLSFKKRGASIERMFNAFFGVPPWPSEDVRSDLLDLVLVRHMIVHGRGEEVGGGGPGEYGKQLRYPGLLIVTSYGEFTTCRIDPPQALAFYGHALRALKAQVEHLRKELVDDDRWMRRSIPQD
jgi:hypothetical protein